MHFRDWVFNLCKEAPEDVGPVLLALSKQLPRWGLRIQECLREPRVANRHWALQHFRDRTKSVAATNAYGAALAALELTHKDELLPRLDLTRVLWHRDVPGREPEPVNELQNTADFSAARLIRVHQDAGRDDLDTINRRLTTAAEAARREHREQADRAQHRLP